MTMLKLHIIQAEHGDCFILESGTSPNPKYILIDGGPESIYTDHLANELKKIRDAGGKLDVVVASHVDTDHIIGLLDLMTEIREQRSNNETEIIEISELWHNSFDQTVGRGNDIENRMKTLLANSNTSGRVMDASLKGIGDGHKLRLAAMNIGVPINSKFASLPIIVEDTPKKIKILNLELLIVGPTTKNLEELRIKWLQWLDKFEDILVAGGNPMLAAMADSSVPNLSSIMFLVKSDGKTILFTGDGRGDHLLQGLSQANLLNSRGKLHVDVLKVPHHGSGRNVTKKFLRDITASKYVISANGKHQNPDFSTLVWIVESAKDRGENIEIIVTNITPSTKRLTEEFNSASWGYSLRTLNNEVHSMTLKLN
jgi:ribonuclease BN (tRNA processing enzyme)